jgi:hypothetical protein
MNFEYKKQISIDSLLGIQEQHTATCPIINALQFTGPMSSKIYDVNLDYNPRDLKISIKPLIEEIDNLVKWCDDLINIYNNLPVDKQEIINNKSKISDIENLREQIEKDTIIEMSSDINALIESWIDYQIERNELKTEELTELKNVEITEKELLLIKIKKEDTLDKEEVLSFYKEELLKVQENIEALEDRFNAYVKNDFEDLTKNFSEYLEIVRNRNDDLRGEVGELRYHIVQNCKDLLAIYQPDEYLDKKFGIKNNIVNLGLLTNTVEIHDKNEDKYFNSLILGLRNKKYIDFSQLNRLIDIQNENKDELRSQRQEAIFEVLKENGIQKVRYYNNQIEFKENRESYKEKELNKAKNKMAP